MIQTTRLLLLYWNKLHYRKEVKGNHVFPLNYMANITLDLYRTPSDERMVSKTLNDKFSFDKINLKQDCSITNPVFVLGKTSSTDPMDTVGWWRKFNYCYCPNLERYYYIRNIVFQKTGLVELQCDVDPLMSFKDDILNSTQLVTRQENKQQRYIPDTSLPIHSQVKTEIRQFGENVGGVSMTLLLQTSGKGGSAN